jgi:two-component system, OmpR family, sensor histidine kinase ChvG
MRILAVNILALIFLGGGVLYVDQLQNTLIQTRTDELIKDANIMAGALGEAATVEAETTRLLLEPARNILLRLVSVTNIRTRYFGVNNELLIDSREMSIDKVIVENTMPEELSFDNIWKIANREISEVLDKIQQRDRLEDYHEVEHEKATDFPEIMTALTGEPSSRIRRLTDDSDIITVAVPVQRFRRVLGALMLSADTKDIYETVRDVRLAIIKFFFAALLFTLLMSLFFAKTIVSPILRLAHSADRISLGGKSDIPDLTSRNDEIGDLSKSLKDMTEILAKQIDAVASFAADVAHELKNPLTSMRSALETMEHAKTDENRKKMRDIIGDDIRRLDRLITDISDVSRLDAEMSHASMKVVNLTALLETLVDIYITTQKHRLPNLHLDIKKRRFKSRDEKPAPYLIKGLEGQLGQVVRNLLDNAISFSEPSGNIWIRMRSKNNMVELIVEDEGIGIPEDKLDNIFDRFYSERPKGEAFGKHSGLGLNICKQVVEAHRGKIYATNRLSKSKKIIGARFVVLMPLENN